MQSAFRPCVYINIYIYRSLGLQGLQGFRCRGLGLQEYGVQGGGVQGYRVSRGLGLKV